MVHMKFGLVCWLRPLPTICHKEDSVLMSKKSTKTLDIHVKESQQRLLCILLLPLVSKHCMLQRTLSIHFLFPCSPEQAALTETGIMRALKTDRNMQASCIYCLFLETREKEIKS